MKLSQVAAQLYTVREFLNDRQEISTTFKKLKDIGYQVVQISARRPLPEEEIATLLDEAGLVCCATHEPGDLILNQPEVVIERLQKLRCTYTAYPIPRGVKLDTEEDVVALAESLNQAGKILCEAGIVLTYHNHNIEFRRYGSKTMLEIIYDNTDPRYVQGELDTYWVQAGGGDPVAWCESLKGRLPLLHIKDYIVTPDEKQAFAEIGSGNLNFRRIIPAAEASGCQWFIVEQDTCPGDPFDSLAKSFSYIKNNLCK